MDRAEWRGGSKGDQREGTPTRVTGALTEDRVFSDCNMSVSVGKDRSTSGPSTDTTSSSSLNTVSAAPSTNSVKLTSDGREKADRRGEAIFPNAGKEDAVTCSTSACTLGGNRTRDAHLGQEELTGGEAAPPGSRTCRKTYSNTAVTGKSTMVANQEDIPHPALPRLQQLQHQIQQHQLQLRQQNQQLSQQQPNPQQKPPQSHLNP
ncbi:hypothetical protein LDENG_00287610, partial [Lucifuga dentata]